ncbi:MAG TPA: methyltransferase [Thermoplasmata archaeon]|nr:methyltransferase [Thermoplasmata archaeon]
MDPTDAPEDAPPEAEHYFTVRPRSPHRRRELRFLYRGEILVFETDAGVFASEQLDPGTSLLIEAMAPSATDRILDIGCGWGPIGLAAAKAAPQGHVVLTDVNRRAVLLARGNARRNKIANAEVRPGSLFDPVRDDAFDLIVTNPPYHAGRELVLRLLSEAPAHLREGGRLLLVGKGSQGIQYYQRWLGENWAAAEVEVLARGSGYRVLEARPRLANRHP